ncbi:MAG: IS630 family transposase, partial [Hyphomicrobiaceae bacterium]|nr:IS630 family transposase [Hyphomicrobiaceae bacterium]
GDLKTVCRITSVLSVLSGYTALETAEIMQLPVKTIYDWVKKFLLGGVGALINKKKAGRPSKLTKNQRRQLSKLIDNGPEKSGFSGSCWRSPMIQELIHRTFKIFYSARYISELLKNMGFSYQKARFVAGKQDELAREQWIKSTWKSILEAARKKPSYILFGDEVSFPQWGTLSYTWARKGQQPVIKTSGTRRAYKVFGLIDYFTGKLFSKGHEGRFNAESYIDFLQEVLSMTRKPIFLIQDGAPYHKGKKVKAFFEKHKNRLTVHTLPSYSPDFNPIEGLWKKIKDQGTHLKYFLTFDSLIDKVEEMLITFECASDEILKLFGFYEKI